jgi:hypothetical protein
VFNQYLDTSLYDSDPANVTAPAEKLPLASLATILLAVLDDVADISSSRSTLRFATLVVDETIKGAVPVATGNSNCPDVLIVAFLTPPVTNWKFPSEFVVKSLGEFHIDHEPIWIYPSGPLSDKAKESTPMILLLFKSKAFLWLAVSNFKFPLIPKLPLIYPF